MIVLWLGVQLLQTIQLALLGRKVTRTLMPPPMQAAAPPLYRTCRACGQLKAVGELNDQGLCPDCGITQPTQPSRPRRPPTLR